MTAAQPVATLAGTVSDTAARPLPDVTVSMTGRDLRAITDSAGRFELKNVPPGRGQFTFKRIGFVEASVDTVLLSDSTVVVQVRMQNVQTLPNIDVQAAPRSRGLERGGFYDRQKAGFGAYVTPDEIAKMNVSTPAQYLRNVPFIQIDCSPPARRETGGCKVYGSQGACMSLFVDGVYTRMHLDQRLSAPMVYAMEVYRRSSLVPMEFIRPADQRPCGAIVVWTQSRKQ